MTLFYWSNVFSTFAWSDDWGIIEDNWSHSPHAVRDGRPLFAVLLPIQFHFANVNPSLVWTSRLLGLIGTIALFFILIRFCIKTLEDKLTSISPALPFFLLPLFTTLSFFWLVSWATISSWVFSAVLSSIVAWQIVDNGKSHVLTRAIFSILLLTISFLIYPLYSSFGLVLILAWFILRESNTAEKNRILIRFVSYSILGAAVSRLISIIVTLLSSELLNPKVTELVQMNEIGAKIYWLFSRVFLASLTPYNFHSDLGFVSSHLLLFLFVWIFLYFVSTLYRKTFLINSVYAIAMVLISTWPLIVSRQNQIDHRFILVPSSLVVLFVFLYAYKLYDLSQNPKLRKLGLLAVLGALVFSVSNNNFLLGKVMVNPFNSNSGFIVSKYEACLKSGNAGNVVFSRTHYSGHNPYIGNFSVTNDLDHPWVPDPLIKFVISKEYGIQVNDLSVNNIKEIDGETRLQSYCYLQLDRVSEGEQ